MSRFASVARPAGLGCVIACALGIVLTPPRAIVVSVRNDGTTTIRDVEARTSAGAYPIGDLRPGQRGATLVGAEGDSHARVAWTDSNGERRVSRASGYFEGWPTEIRIYRGTVDAVITDAEATLSSTTTTNMSPFAPRLPAPTPRPPR